MRWPGIEEINFDKLITNKLPIAKGHLDQEQANLKRTKVANDEDIDLNPTDGLAIKTRKNITKLHPLKDKTYSDQTGRFPHRSSRVNKYIMIMYDQDANTILAKAIPNLQAKTIASALEDLHKRSTQHGHETKKSFYITNAVEN